MVEISCRWCGHGRSIETLDEADSAAAPGTATAAAPADAAAADAPGRWAPTG